MNRAYLLSIPVLCLACSNDPSSVSSESAATSATFDAAQVRSVVVQTEERDDNADGTIEQVIVETTRFDAHGNAVGRTFEVFTPPGTLTTHAVATMKYNQHDDLTSSALDFDFDVDGVVDDHSEVSTVAMDKQGHPVHQVLTSFNPDGSIHSTREFLNQFDSRGRLVGVLHDGVTESYEYDAHANVVRQTTHSSSGDDVETLDWSVHSALLARVRTVTRPEDVHVTTVTTTSTDTQGYPTEQASDEMFIKNRPHIERPGNHVVSLITYDGRHRVLTRVDNEDYNRDGELDFQTTTHMEYGGTDIVPVQAMAGRRTVDLVAKLSSRGGGRGPEGPSGDRFAR